MAASLGETQAGGLLKKLNKVFKYSRGPFATSKNGRVLQQNKAALIRALKGGQHNDLAEMYLCGVAKDLGKCPSETTVADVIQALDKKPGSG